MNGGVLAIFGVMIFMGGFLTGSFGVAGNDLWADLHRTFSGEKMLAEVETSRDEVSSEKEKESAEEDEKNFTEDKIAGTGGEIFPQQIILNINMAGATVELKTDKVEISGENLESGNGKISDQNLTKQTESGGKCMLDDYKVPDRRGVYFSEMAWMGTGISASDEWMELKNTTQNEVDLSGWEIRNKDGNLNIVFSEGKKMKAREIMILERGDDNTIQGVVAGIIYKGALGNEDEGIYLFDESCNLIDKAEANKDWPAGNSKEKRTMERDWITLEWKDSLVSGGTPGSDNGVAIAASGGVAGNGEEKEINRDEPAGVAESAISEGKICFSEVKAGSDGNADDEYIKVVNLGSEKINLEGWTIKKKSSTGMETTLVSAGLLTEKSISGKGQMIFGNSEGYSGVADILWPKSYNLAYEKNGVIFYDETGKKIDEINWESLVKGEILKKECK
ncbi:MAG: lamin tail domain-containing protein [Candidatus Pacebacteria bacterium]|nr:lamin tail domain-containing protein [Candidatus Paceibacterota bacterium]